MNIRSSLKRAGASISTASKAVWQYLTDVECSGITKATKAQAPQVMGNQQNLVPLTIVPTSSATSTKEETSMNLSQFLQIATAAPEFLSGVSAVVQAVENDFATLPGAQKLAAATSRVNSILGDAQQTLATVGDVGSIVTGTINDTVSMLNAAGVFSHSAVQAAAPPAK